MSKNFPLVHSYKIIDAETQRWTNCSLRFMLKNQEFTFDVELSTMPWYVCQLIDQEPLHMAAKLLQTYNR